jgi:Flp pilus assembly pilin Flp
MLKMLKNMALCLRAATAIEYVLLVAGIALAISAVVFAFGEDLAEFFQRALDAFNQAEPVE